MNEPKTSIYHTLLDNAHISQAVYQSEYERSLQHNDAYWLEQAKRLDWIQEPTIGNRSTFHKPVSIRWFEDGILNVSANCVDRHLTLHANKTAILWQGDDLNESQAISYQELHDQVCRLSNFLKSKDIHKGDRVVIYMPMVPEAAYAMLACARIGAVHAVVFAGFSAEALHARIQDCQPKLIITADEVVRGSRHIPLKANCDKALADNKTPLSVLVVKRTGASISMQEGRDAWWHDSIPQQSSFCAPEPMQAEDPLFILYTSGSTGKPKGVLHTSGGYLTYASLTHKWIFDSRPEDVYWCTADVGWVTGHTYVIYGPLSNAATTLMFEGVPSHPDHSRSWHIVEKHQVNVFYTAPTVVRALMREHDDFVKKHNRSSLRLLGSVGEPINPEAWHWYYHMVGDSRCPIVDTWWQTETGGILITPLPGAIPQKPGSATLPFFGVEPCILHLDGVVQNELEADGVLCIKSSWPGQMRTLYNDHASFENIYFSSYPGYYFSGDGARRDHDGYYWISGRVDDVINVSGHRLGTAEIESAIGQSPYVAESAVVGYPHDLKGQGIFAFVILNSQTNESNCHITEIKQTVRDIIGPIATPDEIVICEGLPKTRSGKIMRRLLRKIAAQDVQNLGDTSTLADPHVVDFLVSKVLNAKLANGVR